MGYPLEVADVFRAHGPAWRAAQHGHLSLGRLKVMSAISQCRSAALGGHVLQCPACNHVEIAYNSCRNRHCPKCQGSAALRWLEARQVDLLPVEYYHLVFTLPAPISAIAYTNKALIYGLLFNIAAETLQTIAANAGRREHLAKARELLAVPPEAEDGESTDDLPNTDTRLTESRQPTYVCPDCGAPMWVIQTSPSAPHIRAPPQQRDAA